jgi:hypothetical protein
MFLFNLAMPNVTMERLSKAKVSEWLRKDKLIYVLNKFRRQYFEFNPKNKFGFFFVLNESPDSAMFVPVQ